MTPQLRPLTHLTPEAGALLAYAMYPDPARIKHTLEHYFEGGQRAVFGWVEDNGEGDDLICAAGLQVSGREAELLHLATRPQRRGQGHARQFLYALMKDLSLETLHAETDASSVDFYRRAGFRVQPIQTRWGERYRCLLSQSKIHSAT